MADLRDRLSRIAEKADAYASSQSPQTQVAEAKKTIEAHEQSVEVAKRTSAALKIDENPFFKTLSDAQTTQDEKIAAISDALDAQKQTAESLAQNFRLFQEYYTYIQSEDMNESLENVKRLIAQLQDNSKIEVAKILTNLKGMQDDIMVSRQLIEVLRKSRISGETVKQMSEALDRNDRLIKEQASLEKLHGELAGKVNEAKALVDRRIREKEDVESKLSNKILGLFKKDTGPSDRLLAATAVYDKFVKDAAEIDSRTQACIEGRRKDLEEGPLAILRSVDEVDDNLTDRLISSGQKGVATIQGAQIAVLQLMDRTVFSEAEVDKIGRRINDRQISLTVLKAGLQDASAKTDEFKRGLETKSTEAEAALATTREGGHNDVLDTAKKETAAISLRGHLGEVIDYQQKLNNTITEVGVTASRNIERQAETDSARAIVQGTKKSISILGRDTLGMVAGNLETVLHNLVADQNDEMRSTITSFTQSASTIKEGLLQGMIERRAEMAKSEDSLLDSSIDRLNKAAEIVTQVLETSVDEGIKRAEKQDQLRAATVQLEEATMAARKVVGSLSDAEVQGKGRGAST